MSLPYRISSLSRNRKHLSAEIKNKGDESAGSDPVNPDGPPPALAHRVHSRGKESDATRKIYSGRCLNSTTADETQRDRHTIVSAEAKSALRRVKESSNVYLPLKSVAKDLCFILDNCEVQFPSQILNPLCLRSFQRTEVNRRAIESLAPRIKTLSESLREPIPPSDFNEKERVKRLEW